MLHLHNSYSISLTWSNLYEFSLIQNIYCKQKFHIRKKSYGMLQNIFYLLSILIIKYVREFFRLHLFVCIHIIQFYVCILGHS